MTWDQLIALCNPITVTAKHETIDGRVQHDSRKIKPGDIFVAVAGLNVDGRDFVPKAIENGAKVVVAEQEVTVPDDVALLIVDDSRVLLNKLALAALGDPQKKLRFIGVTGTNGKTTVTTLVYQVLTSLGEKAALLGTVARIIGGKSKASKYTTSDPVELAEDLRKIADLGTEFVSMEVSSHALDQDRVSGLDFEAAGFTNLTLDHLDYHKTMEAYAAAKQKLFHQVPERGFGVINGDDPYGSYMAEGCRGKVYTFGQNIHLPYRLRINSNTASGLALSVNSLSVESPLVGEFNAYNVAQAFLICTSLGFEPKDVAEALKTAQGAPGRLDRITIDSDRSYPHVFVDYAHTPDALEKVSSTLHAARQPHQQLVIVFGCGGDRDRSKRPVMGKIAETYGDRVIVTSDNPRTEDPEAIIDEIYKDMEHPEEAERISDRKKAIEHAITSSSEDDLVLIAGKGHEDYQEINGKRHPFDDRKIAKEAIQTWYSHHLNTEEG